MKVSAKSVLREFTENKELMSEQKVVVKPAGHKGNGLFAKNDIKKGEMILKAKVKIIDNDDWKLIKNTEVVKLYTLGWGDEHGIPVGPWEFDFKNEQDKRKWKEAGLLEDGNRLMISGFLYINDIDDKTEANAEEWFDVDGKMVGMVALRDIKIGEEIIKEYDGTMAGKWRTDLNEGLNLVKKPLPIEKQAEQWFLKKLKQCTNRVKLVTKPYSTFLVSNGEIIAEIIDDPNSSALIELVVQSKLWYYFAQKFKLRGHHAVRYVIRQSVCQFFGWSVETKGISIQRAGDSFDSLQQNLSNTKNN